LITRIAGASLLAGYAGDGGQATHAYFNQPQGLALDSHGNIFVADTGNHVIRKISPDGIITTVAGTGVPGRSGDGGPATQGALEYPRAVAVDGGGTLYIADSGNYEIRKVAPNQVISTVTYQEDLAHLPPAAPIPYGLAVDSAGNLFFTDYQNSAVHKIGTGGVLITLAGNGSRRYSGDNGPATNAQLNIPTSVAVATDGTIYVADTGNHVVRKIATDGTITTVAGTGAPGFAGDGGPAPKAKLNFPVGIAIDPGSNLYIADEHNSRVRSVAVGGTINTVAGNGSYTYTGDGGLASAAQLDGPWGAAFDASGNLYISDWNSRIRKITPDGMITTVAGTGVIGYSGDGGQATSAEFNFPGGLKFDAAGNLYIADFGNDRVRKVTPSGIVTTVAGNGTNGHSGDGGQATSAQLSRPAGLAFDAMGNLYIAEFLNARVRKVARDGTISTFAGTGTDGYSGDGGPAAQAEISGPWDIVFDGAGNLYIAETYNEVIRKVAANGAVSTVGGPAAPQFMDLTGIALDTSGNLIVSSVGGIDKVAPDGTVTLISQQSPHYAQGCPSRSCLPGGVFGPQGLAVDATGTVYASDSGDSSIVALVPSGTRALLGASLSHQGTFAPGAGGFTVSVSNVAGAGATAGAVTVTEFLPEGMTLTSMSGSGWNCAAATCSRSDSLPDGKNYPPITISVQVSGNASPQMINRVAVSGGGSVTIGTEEVANFSAAASGPSIQPGGIVNAASYGATVAPGSIAAVFGSFGVTGSAQSVPLPTMISGFSMQFVGAYPAPLFAVSSNQANVQIPWELAGLTTATLAATSNSQAGTPQTLNLVPFAPGIFTTTADGTGQGVIVDASYRLFDSSHPATAGSSVAIIFCTGLGPVTNQPVTGAASPANPPAQTISTPTVTIGGANARVLFSSLAPGLVGAYQVNVEVPADSALESAVPVSISIGGITSNTVTMAVGR